MVGNNVSYMELSKECHVKLNPLISNIIKVQSVSYYNFTPCLCKAGTKSVSVSLSFYLP